MTALRIAIVGCGKIARDQHVQAIAATDGAVLAAAADPNASLPDVPHFATLEKLLLSSELGGRREGVLKLLAVEERPSSILRGLFASLAGKLGREKVRGVHFEEADQITIHGDNSNVILDGETFRAERGFPINLKPAQPLSFVRLAA